MFKRITALLLCLCMLLSLFAGSVFANDTADYSASVGKYAQLNPYYADSYILVHDGSANFSMDEALLYEYTEFEEDLIFRITDWYLNSDDSALWYQVEAYQGALPGDMPAGSWIMQNYTDAEFADEDSLLFVEIEPEEDQTDVTLNGEPVSAVAMPKYDKPVLSATTNQSGDVSYRWQILADGELWVNIYGQTAQNLTLSYGLVKSLLVENQAWVRCVTTADGVETASEAVCVTVQMPEEASAEETAEDSDILMITNDDAVMPQSALSNAIRARSGAAALSVATQDETGSSGILPLAEETDDGEELQKSYVVVQYEYEDGRTAAASYIAELIPGKAYSDAWTLPVIPGYAASLPNKETQYGNHVNIADGELSVNYAEGELIAGEYIIIKVVYKPDYVNYTVIHYWQNIDNDNYTEHARETIENKHKTGEVINDAHESYDGFFNLLYETPTAAADGSTVIEVYYDRYYYLMTFDLGTNGYGVEPIYARYGQAIEIGTPTRAGYTFGGWTLNGEGDTIAAKDMPKTVPDENRKYVAQWKMVDTAKVSVVIWGENPNDEEYSYLTTGELMLTPNTEYTYNGTDQLYLYCDKEVHSHDADCIICGKEEHTQHTEECLGKCTHSEHTLDCFSAGNYELVETSKPSQITSYPTEGIYTYTTSVPVWGTVTHYYLYLGGKWYCADGEWYEGGSDIAEISLNCSHTHTDSCYTCETHAHTAACYGCGKEVHTHDSNCTGTVEGLNSALWTFVKSDTITVNPDGSSVINVYYDRTTFTMTFKEEGNNGDTLGTITDKWGADIKTRFETISKENTFFWSTSSRGGSPWTSFMDVMPQKNSTYYADPQSGSTTITATYLAENLEGTGYETLYTVSFKGSSSITVTEEEFVDIEGFTFNDSLSTDVGDRYNGSKFYYDRHKYAIEFYNPTTLLKKETGIYYESAVSSYYWEPDATQAPAIYEPGSVQFAGWYLNPECTGAQYDFNAATSTMPAGTEDGATTLILYAKWEPVEYKVNYYLTKESLGRKENIPTEMARLVQKAIAAGTITEAPATDPYTTVFAEDIVKHGAYITDPADPKVSEGYESIHPRAGYDFIGWFYLNDDGEETAFDPENLPVKQSLDLYAKWSSNVLRYYNVYFALDENADGIADTDADGKIIYVADPISGSAIAGRTYTFTAKGGEDLYDPDGDVTYQEGYFPLVGSHSIVIDIQDETGTGANSFTFLYRPKTAVPYTVKYIDKATGESVIVNGTPIEDKVVGDNKNVVVTENFVYINGYMPDAYQKTLVVTDDGDTSNDVITFYYTKDEEHALYVANYYIQDLDDNLDTKGWTKYTSVQNQGDIGAAYSAEAITIDGFTLSKSHTDYYNISEKINGMTSVKLPAAVGALTDGKITGTLTDMGMELNFYYTRNLYPYEFRYMLNGTTTKLADPEFGKAGYDTVVTEAYKEIVMDLDGDGINEDYRLYDPTETTKNIHIIKDGDPLTADSAVSEGQAKVNIATFYYVRCTQTLTVKKVVEDEDKSDTLVPDLNREYVIRLLIHATSGYHMNSYAYTKSGDETGTLSPIPSAPNTLQFTLKHGQTITIEGLPTAEYTVYELDLPTGYYDAYAPKQRNKLTVDGQLDVVVTNTFAPANLTVTKTVEGEDNNTPAVKDFAFTITVPAGMTGSYNYTVGSDTRTATIADGKMTLTLEKGQTATFLNLPVGTYAVEEADYTDQGYNSSFRVNNGDLTEGRRAEVTLVKGTTQAVDFLNKFPVGDLTIQKTVTKEFYGENWSGDTFTFTVKRTSKDLIVGNTYNLELDGAASGTATVLDDKSIQVTITFTTEDAAKLDEETEKGLSVAHALTIKNLPVGSYTVQETGSTAYATKVNDTDNLETTVEVTDQTVPAQAVFENTLKRTTGSLYLKKTLKAATGFNPDDLPEGTKFSFTITLINDPPESAPVQVSYNDGEAVPENLNNGSLTVELEKNQHVMITGLPVGNYHITEAAIPSYANTFYLNVDDQWVKQPPASTALGALYVATAVNTNATTEVWCENTYPVDRAELVLQKLVTKEYEKDILPDDSFQFTVGLTEEDRDSYNYVIYDQDGSVYSSNNTAAVSAENTFTVTLKAGQYAVIPDMPVCGYTITEKVDTQYYDIGWQVFQSETGDTASTTVNTSGGINASGKTNSVSRTFVADKTDTVVFTNQYKRQVADLVISRTNAAEDQVFVYEVKNNETNETMTVTVTGNDSVTIHDVPVGEYTVTQKNDWSWRYTDPPVEKFDHTKAGTTVTFDDARNTEQWLNGNSALVPNEPKKKEGD